MVATDVVRRDEAHEPRRQFLEVLVPDDQLGLHATRFQVVEECLERFVAAQRGCRVIARPPGSRIAPGPLG
jgi:hypothetical protein